eukprot:scaffold13339_cov28-Tisochrysis_lutea.AAC.3
MDRIRRHSASDVERFVDLISGDLGVQIACGCCFRLLWRGPSGTDGAGGLSAAAPLPCLSWGLLRAGAS